MPQEQEKRYSQLKRTALSVLFTVASSGCQLFSSPEGTPVVPVQPTGEPIPTVVPASIARKLSPGTQYDTVLNWLNTASINYEALHGGILEPSGEMFHETMDAYLAADKGRGRLPISITFRDQNDKGFQLAYSEAVIGEAFVLHFRGDSTLCAPTSEDKVASYRRLMDEFENGKVVDKSLLQSIAKGASPDCDYFRELEKIPRG